MDGIYSRTAGAAPMSMSNPLLWPKVRVIWGYGIALLSVYTALLISRWPPLRLETAPVSLFLGAIMLSAWFGGIGPGLLATALSSLAFDYYFLPPIYSLVAKPAESLERKHAEEALRHAQGDLARVSRITTLGELTASLAHEVNQPIAAAVTNANTCLRWLTREHPDLGEAREAASRIVKDATRAAEIVGRTRLLFKKGTAQRELVSLNEMVREMIVLLRGEATRHKILIGTDLATGLPQVTGDRVLLQQVLMNLMLNGIEAMKDVDGKRELLIKSQETENEEVILSVSDTGVGLPAQQADQIFKAFFTTKPQGTGMGLSISRSIVEAHGGRLWADGNSPRGASFCFTLSTKSEGHG